jgi:hypothetical protein
MKRNDPNSPILKIVFFKSPDSYDKVTVGSKYRKIFVFLYFHM